MLIFVPIVLIILTLLIFTQICDKGSEHLEVPVSTLSIYCLLLFVPIFNVVSFLILIIVILSSYDVEFKKKSIVIRIAKRIEKIIVNSKFIKGFFSKNINF